MNKQDESTVELDPKSTYEKIINDLNRQLYDAYGRIEELNQELKQEREKNAQD